MTAQAHGFHPPGGGVSQHRPGLELLEAVERVVRAGPQLPQGLAFEIVLGAAVLARAEGKIAVQTNLDAGLVLLGEVLAEVDGEGGRQGNGPGMVAVIGQGRRCCCRTRSTTWSCKGC